MNIKKFNEYLTEAINLPILDVVIDNNGIPHDGKNGTKLVKGRVRREGGLIRQILGTDNINYPGGIDKNGNLVGINVDDDWYLLTEDGNRISIPQQIKDYHSIKNDYWMILDENHTMIDYHNMIPNIATGWVNVKVDMEIIKRIRRYSRGIGSNNRGHNSFLSKLDEFQRMSDIDRSPQYINRLKTNRVQKEMSVIILLHYINEVKDFFTPSSSGFLFESFLAGLIPNARVNDDNTAADIRAGDDRYQVKLLNSESTYTDAVKVNDEYLDYYLISLKYVDRVEIYVIDGSMLNDNNTSNESILTPGGKFKINSIKSIKPERNNGLVKKFTIDLTDIEGRINNLGQNLKIVLDKLYGELSKFQYNIETIITGVDENGDIVDDVNFNRISTATENNLDIMRSEINNLITDIRREH